jgi:hypothetical protein
MKSKNLKVLFLFSAIIIFSFHNNLQALQKGIERYKRKELDQVTIYEKKFIELKAFLQDHMVVGYDSICSCTDYTCARGKAQFYCWQFS